MNPTIAGALIASGATLVSFALGALTTSLANRVTANRALRERAEATYAQVVAGVTRFQLTVEDFHRRRTSCQAKGRALSEVVFDVVVAIFDAPAKPQSWLHALAVGYRGVNTWDRDESDRLEARLDSVFLQAQPALFQLEQMDPSTLAAPGQALREAWAALGEAITEEDRTAKSADLSAAVFSLGGAVGRVIRARWSHVLPRRRKSVDKALTGATPEALSTPPKGLVSRVFGLRGEGSNLQASGSKVRRSSN
jgi:hypothetical protein